MTSPTSPIPEENVPEEPGVGFFAKFFASLDTLNQQLARANRLEQARLALLPNFVSIAKLSAPGVATTDIVSFGGPQAGRQWTVRMLSAVSSALAANASVVHWYVGQIMPGNQPPQPTEAVWMMASVPNFETFGGDEIKVLPNQHLIAYLTSIPASSSIALRVAINDQTLYSQSTSVAATE